MAATGVPSSRVNSAIAAPPLVLTRSAPSILLVEDNDSLRGLAAEVLRAAGYDVVECDSSEAALAAARAHPGIGLLISDVALCGMTGIDLAAAIAGDRPDMAVLYISGYPEESVSEVRLAAKSRFLQKPFGAGSLIANVRALLAA